jgi:hypothetical protein
MSNHDDFLRRQEQIIDTVGWAVMHVLPAADDPDTTTPFAYTVGLTAHDYPELLIAGLPPEVAHGLLNDLAGRVYDRADRFTHGQRVSDLIAGYDAVLVEGARSTNCYRVWRSPATDATGYGCCRSCGRTRTADSRGTPDTTSTRTPSR